MPERLADFAPERVPAAAPEVDRHAAPQRGRSSTERPLVPGPVRRIAVFRALVLGDLLCATPALRALRAGFPGADIALVGLPWAAPWVARQTSVDRLIEFPGWPGLPERAQPSAAEAQAFVDRMRAERFDLALQLHGSGAIVNPLVAAFGARLNAGFFDPARLADAGCPPADTARFTPWPSSGSEVERCLALTDHLGLPRCGAALDFPLFASDRADAARLLHAWRDAANLATPSGEPYAIVHAGSQLPSRRWPPERFAAVADALADAGHGIVLTGTAAEAGLTARVAAHMRHPAFDAAGLTTLWTLGALVERAALVVCNDTGLSHVAAALGTPSVVVASGSDVARWRPADAHRHRVLWQDVACRPCGHAECPVAGHPCATGVGVDAVREAALSASPDPFGPPNHRSPAAATPADECRRADATPGGAPNAEALPPPRARLEPHR